MQSMMAENERAAVRSGYEYAQDLASGVADQFPNGTKINPREEILWAAKQVTDDPQERNELLPYVCYGFQQGTLDRLYKGIDRYQL